MKRAFQFDKCSYFNQLLITNLYFYHFTAKTVPVLVEKCKREHAIERKKRVLICLLPKMPYSSGLLFDSDKMLNAFKIK